jgi:cytoskeletal protein CcmA (bactofilin family)
MALRNFRGARAEQGSETAESTSAQTPSAPTPRTVAPSTSIDATSEFNGTLSCKGTVRIDGTLIGELTSDKAILIGEGGDVRANITADTIEVAGHVQGNITARSKLTLKRTAQVDGDLATPGIVVEEGAQLAGRILIGSAATPEKAAEETNVKTDTKERSKQATPRAAAKQAETAFAAAAPN